MLTKLKLVKGAVDTKNLVPVLTHFHIDMGKVQGGNGRVTIQVQGISELADFDNVTCKADAFVDAIESCDDTEPTITRDAEYVHFTAGRFKCKVQRIPEELFATYPVATPDPARYTIQEPLLPALTLLRKFVGEDASRPWAVGAWFDIGGWVYGTNNVTIARVELPAAKLFGHSINVPNYVLDELLRISREPICMGLSDNSVTFYYDDGMWLQGRLLVNDWPAVHEWFEAKPTVVKKVPARMLEEVLRISAFTLDKKNPIIYIAEGELVCGNASVSGFKLPEGAYRTEPLELVLSHATHVNFAAYPGRVYWRGANVEGFFVGVKT